MGFHYLNITCMLIIVSVRGAVSSEANQINAET